MTEPILRGHQSIHAKRSQLVVSDTPKDKSGPGGDIFAAVMSDEVFDRLSEFIYGLSGIKMSFAKKTMLEGRLRKRLRALGMDSFQKYCDYLFSPRGFEDESIRMVDAITTNKTDFFREPAHFDYLVNTALPDLIRAYGVGFRRKLNVWSAGCSTGEEPYTLAIVLSEFAERLPGFVFSVYATDICTAVLEKGACGIYTHDRIEDIPLPIRKKYFLRSRDREKDLVCIVPRLKHLVRFERLNLTEGQENPREPMDIIFCRNVIIYFDRPTQQKVLSNLCRHLVKGGYLFTGHSETLHGLNLPLIHHAQGRTTVYRKL